jgi:acetyl-CoA carboxylase/biotin carboxylase 1
MQVALQFADLHDRAGRMQAKNTIRQALTWKNARRFFYWRVRRRISEEYIVKRMLRAAPFPVPVEGSGAIASNQSSAPASDSPRATHLRTLHSWTPFLEDELQNDDRRVASWYEENKETIQEKIESLKSQAVASQIADILFSNRESGLKGIQQALSFLPVEEKEAVLKYLGSSN